MLRTFTGPYAVRNRCLIKIGINVGLRISNLCHLTMGQVWHAGRPTRYIRLRARTMKARRGLSVPLNTTARTTISELVAWKKARGESLAPEAPLFLSRHGSFLSTRRAQELIQEAARDAHLESGVASHSLRKSFATRLQDSGVGLRIIQELLGHRQLTTTAAYLGVSRRALEDSVTLLDA